MSDTITGPTDEYAELVALTNANGGRITPEIVLEAATNPASSFHKHINWDVDDAARRFQLQQAGAIIRKFRIVREANGRTIRVDAFVRVPDSANGYAPTQDVVTLDWVVQQKRLRLIASMEKLAIELRHWDEFTALADVLDEALAETSTTS